MKLSSVIKYIKTGKITMNSLTDFKPISAMDLLKENISDEKYKAIMRIEKIGMQRTRAANNGVLKLVVETYNKNHTDSKLKLIADGIIVEYKINDRKI